MSPYVVCSTCLRAIRAARWSTISRNPMRLPIQRTFSVARPATRLYPSRAALTPTASMSTGAVIAPKSFGRRAPSATQLHRGLATVSSPTKVVSNPRKDEDGNDMVMEITPRAAHRLKELMDSESNPNILLRISVESGGCHGFQYLMSLTDMSKVSEEDDTIFESGDGTGARIVLDGPSLELLKGSKVDYTMELIGSQFKIADNPHATSSCGCGTSFDING
ncbi:hypothetical protein BDY21DRAFT_388133 [Lineolata rhizophorae]|uniref:Core domain-containing protein n=1 Tax=Lineolata rhizophorae TaxID=578093 RepID=A0A6A6NNL2_9PEZI|nr:hypothetical protein BDY21DRAFT_388133 [Lineolata rhizophorae]